MRWCASLCPVTCVSAECIVPARKSSRGSRSRPCFLRSLEISTRFLKDPTASCRTFISPTCSRVYSGFSCKDAIRKPNQPRVKTVASPAAAQRAARFPSPQACGIPSEGRASFPQAEKNKSAQIKNFITLLNEIGIASFQHFGILCVGLGEAVNIASISFRSERVLEDFVGQVYLGISEGVAND